MFTFFLKIYLFHYNFKNHYYNRRVGLCIRNPNDLSLSIKKYIKSKDRKVEFKQTNNVEYLSIVH